MQAMQLIDLDGRDCKDLMLQNLQGYREGSFVRKDYELAISVAVGDAVTTPFPVPRRLGEEMHVASSHGSRQRL